MTAMILVTSALGCTDEMSVATNDNPMVIGDSFTISGSMFVPDMTKVTTRGTLNETANDELVLTVFEFDLGEDAESSFLSNIYQAELLEETGVNNGNIVRFNLTLKSSVNPKVLHFMLADKPLSAPYGSVASILSTLTVGKKVDNDDVAGNMGGDDDGGDDGGDGGDMLMSLDLYDSGNTSAEGSANYPEAYWGYVEFPNGYIKTSGGKPLLDKDGNMILHDDIANNLHSIPLVRNFARITVEVGKGVDNFELKGFKIVNVPTSGTIGPWDTEKLQVPTLLYKDNDEEKGEMKGEMKKYSQIDYKGIVPGDADFENQEADAKLWNADDFYATPAYIYEHPYESTRRSYLIVYGTYSWTDAETHKQETADGFYKIDIGKTVIRKSEKDEEYKAFEYYNIIRNIHYNVVITKVEAKGWTSVGEAITHTPFNNISASTETSSMLNISDGHNLLILNKLNHIVVDNGQTIDVLYRYIKDVTGKKEEKNGIPKVIGLTKGDVIKSFTKETDEVTVDGANWKKITLEIQDPTSVDAKTQSFLIVGENGLSRTVNITLRKPWKFQPIGKINGEPYYATVTQGDDISYELHAPEDVSSKRGKNFTVYFNLPEGLDDKMFPLVFQLESKAQGIENNKIGTLVVTTGPSLFDPNLTTISYIKKVSYEEYLYKYNGNSNNLDKSQKNSNRTIRCRFTTIIDAELDDAEIKIHNEYFSPDISAKFRRVSSK